MDINAIPQANWINEKVREGYSEPLVNIELCQQLVNHIDYCMLKFTTYFMIGNFSSNDDDDGIQVLGVAIIEKNVVMNSEEERSLIHYLLVHDNIRCENIGTAMLQMIMSQKDYHEHKIMCVTKLAIKYQPIVASETADTFFFNLSLVEIRKKEVQERRQ